MSKFIYLLFCLFYIHFSIAQSPLEVVDQVDKEGILEMLKELSGEVPTSVNGQALTISHRISAQGNDDAAFYIKEKLESFGLQTDFSTYSSSGRNVTATQLGTKNPDNIYIICGHYDSVGEHGADDNASGTVAVLETARILSQYQLENTIIYALWDEEEEGLKGSHYYAEKAENDDLNILGVLNVDMIGYDGNNDGVFDIDVVNVANSYAIRDALIGAVERYDLELLDEIVDPGTSASDQYAFWVRGFSAVLLGEAWSENDISPGYHTNNDRINLFNTDYFWNMVKLCTAFTVEAGVLASTNTNELNHRMEVLLSPNPVISKVTVILDKDLQGKSSLYNMSGRLLQEKEVAGNIFEVNMESFPAAKYFLKIEDHNGRFSIFNLIKN